jgi:hypothetical protein
MFWSFENNILVNLNTEILVIKAWLTGGYNSKVPNNVNPSHSRKTPFAVVNQS